MIESFPGLVVQIGSSKRIDLGLIENIRQMNFRAVPLTLERIDLDLKSSSRPAVT